MAHGNSAFKIGDSACTVQAMSLSYDISTVKNIPSGHVKVKKKGVAMYLMWPLNVVIEESEGMLQNKQLKCCRKLNKIFHPGTLSLMCQGVAMHLMWPLPVTLLRVYQDEKSYSTFFSI